MSDHQSNKPVQSVITDGFWARYIELVRGVVVPYQWAALNDQVEDAEPSHAIENFRIARAQQTNGYLNTYFTCQEPGARWTNLCECHEWYCAGHMIQAAVVYYQATGKRKLLDVMGRFVDHALSVFGDEPDRIPATTAIRKSSWHSCDSAR